MSLPCLADPPLTRCISGACASFWASRDSVSQRCPLVSVPRRSRPRDSRGTATAPTSHTSIAWTNATLLSIAVPRAGCREARSTCPYVRRITLDLASSAYSSPRVIALELHHWDAGCDRATLRSYYALTLVPMPHAWLIQQRGRFSVCRTVSAAEAPAWPSSAYDIS